MPANRCPNPSCEYFNRALPNNAKVCPWCSTPLGNVIAPTPNKPNSPEPIPQQYIPSQPTPSQPITPQQPVVPSRPITPQPTYQPPTDYPTDYQQRPPTQPVSPPYNPQVPRLPLLKFIHTSGKEFQWSGEAGFIGRRSKAMNIPPEIDLTGIPHEGIISRRHGRVSWDWSQNSYMIIDMSTNGMYLNGTALSPGVQYRLMNGDLLQFGQDNLVRFTVYVM
ncbi:FHA domain-containing protein [Nostoc sp. FACHB-152]|uniref:FHA domain-containing protein n=1 Tax=unclassified Nostoc TaxID=2593658 RepID=UPI0016882F64|nr:MULTISPECIES: FHA domain-containing protein [unclassified Nostoc]MBD2449259.1 FHA domain-containing protein [Nostoc sp. FACHB-152]MBD2470463.1 FHA domain-containing protein [Nostoc sp. FACHB-145]